MATPLSAASAYQNQLKLMQGTQSSPEDSSSQSSFMDMVKSAAQGAIDAQHFGEAQEVSAMTGGKVDLSNLVTAVSNAELSLNTIVAVRDRVINAYQDIIKMAI